VTRQLSSTVHEERLASAPVNSVTDMLSARTLLMKPTAVSDHSLITVVFYSVPLIGCNRILFCNVF